ncbi:MAG: hypothetical protein GX174_07120 [Lentisphaerae bacterium]|nr:hypothetical protein [Lentisphaerota bacterium]
MRSAADYSIFLRSLSSRSPACSAMARRAASVAILRVSSARAFSSMRGRLTVPFTGTVSVWPAM